LTYDRHEFRTYNAQHVNDPGLAADPTDPIGTSTAAATSTTIIVLAVHGLVDRRAACARRDAHVTFRVKRRLSSSSGTSDTVLVGMSCIRPEHTVK
jgi:hypothetical protein